ncbi:hypothetical protein [Nocardia sp. NPDC049526]|uniref:hypothetical protein n=1 Tax=Nocardia sp. NPDC049526 TaxID=3364316 RepID=UPI00379E7F66
MPRVADQLETSADKALVEVMDGSLPGLTPWHDVRVAAPWTQDVVWDLERLGVQAVSAPETQRIARRHPRHI